MDLLDIRLLRALGTRPFSGPARAPADLRPRVLARQVGLSRETVRARLTRMRAEGVLRGFHLVPNLHLLGMATTTYHVTATNGREKDATVAAWRRAGHVTRVFDFIGNDLCIEVAHPRAAPPANGASVIEVDGHPPPAGAPTPLAWRIVRALRHDALRPLEDVAAEVGCSARTARRLLRQLADEKCVDVVAVADPSAMEGLVAGVLALDAAPSADAAVFRVLGDHRWSSWRSPDGLLWITAFAATPQALATLTDTLRALAGVRGVETYIPGRVEADPTWIDERLPAGP